MAKRSLMKIGATPRVNLSPRALRDKQDFERTLPKFLLTVVAGALIAAVVAGAGLLPVLAAQSELDGLNNQSADLQAEIGTYVEAQELITAVGTRETDRLSLTANEVMFEELRAELASVAPAGLSIVDFTAVSFGATDESMMSVLGPECLAEGALVSMTVATAVEGSQLAAAGRYLTEIQKLTGFECDALTNAAVEGETSVNFQLSFTNEIRANRFVEGAE